MSPIRIFICVMLALARGARSSAILGLALVLLLGSGCNLIFQYEDRDPDAATEDAASDLDGAGKDGPGDHDPDVGDLSRVDRTVMDTRLPDRTTNKDRTTAKDKFVKLDKGCPAGLTPCGGTCVNLKTSMQHCGKCNSACSTKDADRCLAGVCSCGGSGASCVGGLNCKSAKCQCIQGGLCTGCCDGASLCRAIGTAQITTKCGKAGAQCKTCDDGEDCTTDGCKNGACTYTLHQNGNSCDNSTGTCASGKCCKGCRRSGTCYAVPDKNNCGKAGASCQTCAATTCKEPKCSSSGACTTANAADGTSCLSNTGTCLGGNCCQDCVYNGQCNLGTSHYICGKGGIACQNCTNTTSTKLCVNQTCVAGVNCGSVNCSDGCCSGNTCVKYGSQNNSTCGYGGLPCKPCGPTQYCDKNDGKCK